MGDGKLLATVVVLEEEIYGFLVNAKVARDQGPFDMASARRIKNGRRKETL